MHRVQLNYAIYNKEQKNVADNALFLICNFSKNFSVSWENITLGFALVFEVQTTQYINILKSFASFTFI